MITGQIVEDFGGMFRPHVCVEVIGNYSIVKTYTIFREWYAIYRNDERTGIARTTQDKAREWILKNN